MKNILSILSIILLSFIAFPSSIYAYKDIKTTTIVPKNDSQSILTLSYRYIDNYAVGETESTYLGTDTLAVLFTIEDGVDYIVVSWNDGTEPVVMYILDYKEYENGYAFLCGNDSGEQVGIVYIHHNITEVYFFESQKKYLFHN